MSNQRVEEVENSKSFAIELLQAQVEGALAFHIHICHLLIAEAHHSVYGDPFEMSRDMSLGDLKTLRNTEFTLETLPVVLPRKVALEDEGDPPPKPQKGKKQPPGKLIRIDKIISKYRKRHALVGAEHLQTLAQLVLSSIKNLADESQKLSSKKFALKSKSLGSSPSKPRHPSRSLASVGPRRESPLQKKTSAFKAETPSSTKSLHKDQSVSFNLELLDMEIIGEDVHPLTAAFTVELFRYEALFEQRMSDFAELQRLILHDLMSEINKQLPIPASVVAGPKANPQAVQYWQRSLDAAHKVQLNYLNVFFTAISTVEFPSISRYRRDTAFPKQLSKKDEASSSSSTPEDIKLKKFATSDDYLLLAELLTAPIKAARPHLDLLLHSFVEFMTRNQQLFMDNVTERLCRNCFKKRRIHPRLQESPELLARLDKVKLDTTYMTQAYKSAMLRYSAQLGGLVTAHARNHGKRCKHVETGICQMCIKHVCIGPNDTTIPLTVNQAVFLATVDMAKELKKMTEAPKNQVTLVKPVSPNAPGAAKKHRRFTSISGSFSGAD